MPGRSPSETEALIDQLRRCRQTSAKIAAELNVATPTVCRAPPSRPAPLVAPGAAGTGESLLRRHPGELIHINVKKLGRFDWPGHRVTGVSAAAIAAQAGMSARSTSTAPPRRVRRAPRRRARRDLRGVPAPGRCLVRHPRGDRPVGDHRRTGALSQFDPGQGVTMVFFVRCLDLAKRRVSRRAEGWN